MRLQISKQKIRYENGLEFIVEGAQGLPGAIGLQQRDAENDALMSMEHSQIVHSTDSTTITETLTDAIPAGAFVVGVFGKIKTLVVGTGGIATFLFGITGDTDRFGNFVALVQNTAQDPSDHQVEATALGRFYAAATDILLTGNIGTFTSGEVTVDIFYYLLAGASDY